MRTLYLDCHMGAAGDMLTAALFELLNHEEKQKFLQKMQNLGLPGVEFIPEKTSKCGISGTHMSVLVHGQEEVSQDFTHTHSGHTHTHEGTHLADVKHIISHFDLSEGTKNHVTSIYTLIAEAESEVHGTTIEKIHFHEVGALDAIADVTAVCVLMEQLQVDRVVASEIHVGSGQVKCAHGILPVPAPATAKILLGIPTYGGEIKGELCTPTGAAILRHFVDEFGSQPRMTTEAIGYGCGKKDFPQANLVRAVLGESEEPGPEDDILELACNLDDMTGEEIGFAVEALLAAGALDVYTTPIYMKKNRPAVILTVLCKEQSKESMIQEIYRHTTTIGIRETKHHRYVLDRQEISVQTDLGPMGKKQVSGYGIQRDKWEYEDLARIAKEQGLTLRQVREILQTTSL